MAETFSMSAAAGFAYRRRASGGLLAMAAGAYVLGALVVLSVWAVVNREALAAYLELALETAGGAQPDPNRVGEVMGKLVPGYLVLLPVLGVLYSAFEATCQRWLVRGLASDRIAGLHWGADTWRLLAVFGMWVLFGMAALFAVATIAGLLGALGGSAQGGPNFMSLLGMLLGAGGAIYVAVRLAPAAAITIGREKLSFFEAWRATEGRFGSLFGAFAFLGILNFVASLIAQMVGGGLFLGSILRDAASGSGDAVLQGASLLRFGAFYLLILSVAQVFIIGFMGVNALAALVAHDEGKV